jgi:hypothetical protein
MSLELLKVGNFYSKNDLSEIFENPNIKLVREGVYNQSDNISFYFVDLVKEGKADRFHFNDYFEGDYFHWDSQTTQHINSPKIQEVVKGDRTPLLFVRVFPKLKSKTQPYVYCGRLIYVQHDEQTSNPVHIVFQNIDYIDDTSIEDLFEIYTWKPEKIGASSKVSASKKGEVSIERKRRYVAPTETERKGLVTSRVGQGYYRQLIREKWLDKCPVTDSKIVDILISSHIVPWSQSNDKERLDVNNGILLSPNVDALFDKHLISFTNDGELLKSSKISLTDLKDLGIPLDIKIPINKEMIPYLERHRIKMNEKS